MLKNSNHPIRNYFKNVKISTYTSKNIAQLFIFSVRVNSKKVFCLGVWGQGHAVHYSDVIINVMASQITGVLIVYSTVCSGADQIKHQSSASLAFVRGIHWWPVNSPHKGPVRLKMLPFDDVIRLFEGSTYYHILKVVLQMPCNISSVTQTSPRKSDVIWVSFCTFSNIKLPRLWNKIISSKIVAPHGFLWKSHRVLWKIDICYLIQMT